MTRDLQGQYYPDPEPDGPRVDVFSHYLLPLSAALVILGLWRHTPQDPGEQVAWRNKMALAIAFGVGGVAPDLDGLYGFLRYQDGLYFLQHRGFSHTLMGAPLHGILGVGVLALVAKVFPRRLGWLHWRAAYIPAGALGGFTHLLLDGVTYGGIPLFWPISPERYTLNLYSWLLIWAAPIAGIVIVLFTFGKITTRRVVQLTAVLVILMVINAGLRLENRPELAPGEEAFPRSSHQQWIVLTPEPDGDGWFVQLHEGGVPMEPQWYNTSQITPGSESAVETARGTDAYHGFILNVFGPVVTETRPHEGGGWNITFTAVVPRLDAFHGARWTPTHPDVHQWGLLVMHVDGQNIETTHHGW